MSHTIIRPASAEDRDSALAVAAAGMREFGIEPEFETLDGDLALIGTAHARLLAGLVAERGGEVCGCIVVTHAGEDGKGKLSGFYVDPSSRGHGIGRALLQAAVQEARRAGLLQLTLLTWEHMHAARALYEASGWVRGEDPPAHSGANRAYRLELAAPARIRVFAPDDEAAVVRLWQDCGLTRPWNDPHKDITRKLSEQPELFLVASRDGAIVGSAMAGFDGHRGWIYYLAVAPAQQRSGLGRALMREVESLLRARGCPKINLQVRSSNSGVLAFYQGLGYETEDLVCMGKRLSAD
jgi:ribosomal protein S18 acetylase RimI-like enzyme